MDIATKLEPDECHLSAKIKENAEIEFSLTSSDTNKIIFPKCSDLPIYNHDLVQSAILKNPVNSIFFTVRHS